MGNKEKAKELAHDYFRRCQLGLVSPDTERAGYDCAIKMAQWKDEQHAKTINTIKANIIEARDNKEYYQTNREITLNWILRLIDECYEKV